MNIAERNTILVPTDFTSIANCALDHSKEIAKVFNLRICLLHVAAKNVTKSEMDSIREQLKCISDFNSQQSNLEITYLVKEGNIFDGIADTASDISAELIVMGVHSKYGDQDILGTFAYNVVRWSNVPVMLVKKSNTEIGDNHIIVPVDYSSKSYNKADIAIKFAKQFKCKVYVSGDIYYESSIAKKGYTKNEKELFVNNLAERIRSERIDVKTGVLVKPKTILVPTDFTQNAHKALEHAIKIAKVFDRRICVLHVVGQKTSNGEKERIENQLQATCQQKSKDSGIEITPILEKGSIFDVIAATVSEISAGFIVMGYHGKQNIRNYSRGFAYNVISSSRVPVMTVKKSHTNISDNTFVVHIDFSFEGITKIKKAINIAKHFDCYLHVIGLIHSKSGSFKKEKEKLNKQVNDYLEKTDVKYSVEILAKSKTILVPVDFTNVADFAVDHGVELAKLLDHKIILLHIIGKNTSTGDKEMLENRLKEIANTNKVRSGVDISCKIKRGNIFDDITSTAIELSAEFVVMGVHGKKGLQHILGSYAYRVISGSKIPVMVVKRGCKGNGFKNVVVPIDFSIESRDEVNTALRFARYFDSTLHIIGLLKSKSSVYRIQHEAILKNLTGHIENAGVNVNTEILPASKSGLHDQILEYANKVNADMLMMVAEKGGKIAEALGQNCAEKIIDKAEIPVLTISLDFDFDGEIKTDIYSLSSFIDPFGLTNR